MHLTAWWRALLYCTLYWSYRGFVENPMDFVLSTHFWSNFSPLVQWHSNIDIGRNSSATIEHKKGHCGNTEVLVVRCESTIHREFLLSSYTFLCFSHGNLQMPRTHVVTGHAATIVTRSEVRVIAAKTESLCEVRSRENGFLTDPEVCCLLGSFYRSLWPIPTCWPVRENIPFVDPCRRNKFGNSCGKLRTEQ